MSGALIEGFEGGEQGAVGRRCGLALLRQMGMPFRQ